MKENKRPKWLVTAGIGCLVLLCVCLGLIGGVYLLGDQIAGGLGGMINISNLPGDLEDFTGIDQLPLPTLDFFADQDTPEDNPAQPPQQSDQTSFFDDFSTDALDWPVLDDGITALNYENGAYSIQIREPDYLDGVTIPTVFNPTTLSFDVWGPPGEQGGTTGVECLVQFEGNNLTDYYFVEFDLYYQEVVVGAIRAGEYYDLYDPGDTYGFLPLEYMNPNPDQANTIQITCLPESVTVTVNGNFEYSIAVPLEYQIISPGPMTFFAYTYEDNMAGYKVFFDNIYAYP